MDKKNHWAVILAGGDGERLRPLTRLIAGDERPKQFCRILGSETLLEQTRRRVGLAVPPDQTLIVVTAAHEPFYARLLANLPPGSVIAQPSNQGTAPAILYSLLRLAAIEPGASAAFFPSDHYFSDDERFMAHVTSALQRADAQPELVTLLGIAPETPEVDYGWIEPSDRIPSQDVLSFHRVRRFWEKPSLSLARTLMTRGCLWNSFVMIGRVQAFLGMIRRALPNLYHAFAPVLSAINTAEEESRIRALYSALRSTNFSREVLAKSPAELAVLTVDEVEWSDWGLPQRVLSTLSRMGVRAEWAA